MRLMVQSHKMHMEFPHMAPNHPTIDTFVYGSKLCPLLYPFHSLIWKMLGDTYLDKHVSGRIRRTWSTLLNAFKIYSNWTLSNTSISEHNFTIILVLCSFYTKMLHNLETSGV